MHALLEHVVLTFLHVALSVYTRSNTRGHFEQSMTLFVFIGKLYNPYLLIFNFSYYI